MFQAAARYVYQTLTNSSLSISNMVGPVEQVALDNHPIKGFYFMIVGAPQVRADLTYLNKNKECLFGVKNDLCKIN